MPAEGTQAQGMQALGMPIEPKGSSTRRVGAFFQKSPLVRGCLFPSHLLVDYLMTTSPSAAEAIERNSKGRQDAPSRQKPPIFSKHLY